MKGLNSYIIEKLRINKDIKSFHSGKFNPEDEKEIKNKMADIIKDYFQNNLNIDTRNYITDTTPDEYITTYYSKGNLNLNDVADSLYKLLKPLCTRYKVKDKLIYFYFI